MGKLSTIFSAILGLGLGVFIGIQPKVSTYFYPLAETVTEEVKQDTTHYTITLEVKDITPAEIVDLGTVQEEVKIDSLTSDTTAIVSLPIQQYKYEGEQDSIKFEAWVSGHGPKLDSIKITDIRPIISTEVTRTIVREPKPKKLNITWGPQAGLGYGIFGKQPDMYVGFGAQLNF